MFEPTATHGNANGGFSRAACRGKKLSLETWGKGCGALSSYCHNSFQCTHFAIASPHSVRAKQAYFSGIISFLA